MSLSREEIASRYGMALFEYAKENARLALVHDEVDELIKVLQENPKFELLMASPLLSSNDKILANVEQVKFIKFSFRIWSFCGFRLYFASF